MKTEFDHAWLKKNWLLKMIDTVSLEKTRTFGSINLFAFTPTTPLTKASTVYLSIYLSIHTHTHTHTYTNTYIYIYIYIYISFMILFDYIMQRLGFELLNLKIIRYKKDVCMCACLCTRTNLRALILSQLHKNPIFSQTVHIYLCPVISLSLYLALSPCLSVCLSVSIYLSILRRNKFIMTIQPGLSFLLIALYTPCSWFLLQDGTIKLSP